MERFWNKVDKSDDCWEWTGKPDGRGYGRIKINGQSKLAHRISWELHNGAIPHHDSYHGICVLHKCDNPKCVNPGHLFLGTNADNVHDRVKKNRGAFGSSAGNSKLSEDDVAWIRQLGGPNRKIASCFGINETTVSRIKRVITWRQGL